LEELKNRKNFSYKNEQSPKPVTEEVLKAEHISIEISNNQFISNRSYLSVKRKSDEFLDKVLLQPSQKWIIMSISQESI
jgi:hypothetical protein